MSPPRKLAEIWDVDGGYHLRVEVGAFQRQLGATDRRTAAEVAEYEAIEVLRKMVADYDSGQITYTTEDQLRPRGGG